MSAGTAICLQTCPGSLSNTGIRSELHGLLHGAYCLLVLTLSTTDPGSVELVVSSATLIESGPAGLGGELTMSTTYVTTTVVPLLTSIGSSVVVIGTKCEGKKTAPLMCYRHERRWHPLSRRVRIYQSSPVPARSSKQEAKGMVVLKFMRWLDRVIHSFPDRLR